MINKLLPSVWRTTDWPLRKADDHPFFGLQLDINRILDDIFQSYDLIPFDEGRRIRGFSPSIDVREDEKNVTVKAELPGLEEKDLEVTLVDGLLTIRGEKKKEKEEKGQDYWHREASYGKFQRAISLPKDIDEEKVDAHFKNGVLTVTLSRLEEAKSKEKKVTIRAN